MTANHADPAAPADAPSAGWFPLAAFLTAVTSRLPVLGAWWNQDDWGLLARAAGLPSWADTGARLVSQDWYWRLLYALAGLETGPYTASRLLLHGGSSALVVILARRLGLSPLGRLVAGLLFAVSPLAFTPLYSAAGVQELLGAFFALAALERWLAGGRRNLALAAACGVLSLLSKENALLLPVLLAGMAWAGRSGTRSAERVARPAVVVLLLATAAVEAALVWGHFAHGAGMPYGLSGPGTILRHLAGYGWTLMLPGPFLPPATGALRLAAGAVLWVAWVALAARWWRTSRRGLAATPLAALLSLAPVLPLAGHEHPYYLYLAEAAGSLAVGGLLAAVPGLHPRLRLAAVPARTTTVAAILVLAALGWGYGSTHYRIKARDVRGFPADPLVLKTATSHQALRIVQGGLATGNPVVLLQLPPPGPLTGMSDELGERWVSGTFLHTAVGGMDGPRLILGRDADITWRSGLVGAPEVALVYLDDGPFLRPWGRTSQALLSAVLTLTARGQYARAHRHLERAARLVGPGVPYVFDPDLLPVPGAAFLAREPAFRQYLVERHDEARSGIPTPQLLLLVANLSSVCRQEPGP